MTTTWNPSDRTSGITLSGGNLVAAFAAGNQLGVRSVDRVYTGKYYWEIVYTTKVNLICGIADGTTSLTTIGSAITNASDRSISTNDGGSIRMLGGGVGSVGGTFVDGTVVCIAFDATADMIWFRNGAAGNWNNNAANNPATGVGGISTAPISSGPMGMYALGGSTGFGSGTLTANFGASAFTGAVPSGFTSGFPDSTALVNNAVVTQTALEQWSQGAPVAQLTQVAIEEWTVLAVANPLAVVSQVSLEQWAVIQAAVAAAVAEQYAVSVIT